MIRIAFTIGAVAALAVACAHVATPAEVAAERELAKRFVAERASFDMKSDASKVEVAYLGDSPSTKFGARGCDQECTYKISCDVAGKCEVLEGACEKIPDEAKQKETP